MDHLQQWLFSVVACSLLVSVACRLCPDGAPRQLARFAGGLLVLCALLDPLSAWELPDPAIDLDRYRAAVEQAERELSGTARAAFSDGIARRLAAYIEDKAGQLGADVRAEVTADDRGVPERVTLRGAYCEALSAWLAEELGVAKEKQEWIEG